MKYLKRHTIFESNDDVNINQVLFELKHLHNNSYPGFHTFTAIDKLAFDGDGNYKGFDFDERYFFNKIGHDDLIKDNIDVSSLTESEKQVLIDLHKMALEKFDLDSIPKFDDIFDLLEPLHDIARENGIEHYDVVSPVFNFREEYCQLDIKPFQKMRMFNVNKWEFDMNIFQQISDETSQLYDRLKDMYDVQQYIDTTERYHKINDLSFKITNK